MIRSLYTGETGLKTHQTGMDVIGNNVANVNTVGYKSGRATFDDVFSQTLQNATGSNGNRGSTNPKQIGLGAGISAVDLMYRNGSIQQTGSNTDLALSGAGLFVVKDAEGTYYTRNGDFGFDADGNYVQNGSGLFVQGYMATDGVVTPGGEATNINVQLGKEIAAKATTEAYYYGNLDAGTPVGGVIPITTTAYDAEGNTYNVQLNFTKTAPNSWTAAPEEGKGSGNVTLNFDELGQFKDGSGSVTFTIERKSESEGEAGAGATTSTSVSFNTIFTDVTQYDSSTTLYNKTDGNAAGTLTGVTLDQRGNIIGIYDNDMRQVEAQVALATFVNPQGLLRKGNSLFEVSSNSGEAVMGTSETTNTKITPSSLEMSNVDISNEFSNMIVTQRGFQSNSKVITTSDQNLETAINLKR